MLAETTNQKFKYVGGDPAIDFVNTVGGWVERTVSDELTGYRDLAIRDKLVSYADLLDWGAGAGLISPDESRRLAAAANRSPLAAEDVLDRALRLRRAIYRILMAQGRERATFSSDISTLNSELA